MNIGLMLGEYRHAKEKIVMLLNELEFIENNAIMKVSKFVDDIPGKRKSLYDQYDKVIAQKEELKVTLFLEQKKISKMDKALELLSITHPKEHTALTLRYIENRALVYVHQAIGYSEAQTKRIIKNGENELRKLLKNTI